MMDRNLMLSYEERQREQEAKRKETQQEDAAMFGKLAPASLIYALIYTVCIYKNISGITMPIWIMATVFYVCCIIRMLERKVKAGSSFCVAVMILLGISTFTTGSRWTIWMNYFVFFVLLVGFVLHNLKEDGTWDFVTYLKEITVSVAGAAGHIIKPFTDGNAFIQMRQRNKDWKGRYIVFGILLSVPCVLFLGILLMTADMVFADMVSAVFYNLRFPVKIFGVLFMSCFGFFSSYCGISFIARHTQSNQAMEREKGEPVLAITVTGVIALLYLVFCGIQIVYLFAGSMQLPDGITYAEYARTGFFQLLFICMLNLVLVLSVKKYFKKQRILYGILLTISACTLIMTASSAFRMILYIKAYHLTFLRVFVLTALFAIALVMAGVVASILKPDFPLFRYGILVVSAIYLGFSFSHADYFIASYNLAQAEHEGHTVDYGYLSSLSTDAAPAVARYVQKHPEMKDSSGNNGSNWWYQKYLYLNSEAMNHITMRNFNVSHYIAYRALSGLEISDETYTAAAE